MRWAPPKWNAFNVMLEINTNHSKNYHKRRIFSYQISFISIMHNYLPFDLYMYVCCVFVCIDVCVFASGDDRSDIIR